MTRLLGANLNAAWFGLCGPVPLASLALALRAAAEMFYSFCRLRHTESSDNTHSANANAGANFAQGMRILESISALGRSGIKTRCALHARVRNVTTPGAKMNSPWTFRVTISAAAALLTGCMSAPRDLTFSPTAETALLVDASPARGDVARWAVFRRILPDTGDLGEEFTLEIAIGSGSQLNGGERLVALSARELPAGQYAIVELGIRTVAGNQSGVSWLCTDRAAPVYSLAPGAIAIVRTDRMYPANLLGNQPTPDDDAVRREFESVRRRYSNVSGEATIIEPSYWITWYRELSVMRHGGRCPVPIGFEIRPAPSSAELTPIK